MSRTELLQYMDDTKLRSYNAHTSYDRLINIIDSTPEKFQSVVVVNDASDLSAIDASKLYLIDGAIDVCDVDIVFPTGGASIAGLNGARDVSKLYCADDDYTMFNSPIGSYSGDVVFESITFEASGANSKIFDLDNDENSNAIEMMGVNFTNTTSLGSLTDYRQLLMNNVGFIFIDDGLTFNGNWAGAAILTSIAIGFPDATLFKEGANLVFSGSVRSNINFLSTDPNSILFDFDEDNILSDGGFSLENVRTNATNPLPNISGSSVKARFKECEGIRDTYIGGQFEITTEAITDITAVDTPVKLAGVTTYDDLQHFEGNNSNEFLYVSDQLIEITAQANVAISGGNNDQVNVFFRHWDDSASTFIDLAKSKATLNGGLLGTRAENISVLGLAIIEENDRIELWVENITDSSDVTALLNSFAYIKER